MPRNSSGVYSLPASNPVVPFTTIATSWANPTMSDIAASITDSLDRNGRGGMLAPFKLFDGSVSSPGISFTNEPSLGIYRAGTTEMSGAAGGAKVWSTFADRLVSQLKLENRGPVTHKKTGFKSWRIENVSGDLLVVPSATIDAEDWDATKSTVFFQSGVVGINGTLSLANGFTVTGLVDINGELDVDSFVDTGAASIAGLLTATAGILSNARIKVSTNTDFQSALILEQPSSTTQWYFGFNPGGTQILLGPYNGTTITRTDILIGKTAGNVQFQGINSAKGYTQTGFAATWAASMSLDYTNGQSQQLALSAATTITAINNIPSYSILRLLITNTNFSLTWPGSVIWPAGGAAPNLAAGPNKYAIVVIQNTGALSATYAVY